MKARLQGILTIVSLLVGSLRIDKWLNNQQTLLKAVIKLK
jgi:hypothetical protein